jgi:hypothetical protein
MQNHCILYYYGNIRMILKVYIYYISSLFELYVILSESTKCRAQLRQL